MNIKKGQFLSPEEMSNAVGKLQACKNDKIMLTERGTFFCYNRLVNDMTAMDTMKKLGHPVIVDVTQSYQLAFLILFVSSIGGLILTSMLKPVNIREPKHQMTGA